MQHKDASKAFTRALELGCDDLEHTLFHRAIVQPDEARMISWLEDFVARAEPDARKLPEACYRLLVLHGSRGRQGIEAVNRFFELGLKALSKDYLSSMTKQVLRDPRPKRSCGVYRVKSYVLIQDVRSPPIKSARDADRPTIAAGSAKARTGPSTKSCATSTDMSRRKQYP
jgi:hypothetical protein